MRGNALLPSRSKPVLFITASGSQVELTRTDARFLSAPINRKAAGDRSGLPLSKALRRVRNRPGHGTNLS